MLKSRSQTGFTMIELVVTATLVAAILTTIAGVFVTIGNLNRQSRNLSIATQLAQQRIEIYRNTAYSSIPTGSPAEDFSSLLPSNFGSPKSAVANVTEVQTGLLQVDIAISYKEGSSPKNVQVTTYIAERGINK